MEHPIVFSEEMVEKIMTKKKTQVRKVIKPQPDHFHDFSDSAGWRPQIGDKEIKCPYGEVGDILWVKETLRVGKKLGFIESTLVKPDEWYFFTLTEKNNPVKLVDKWTTQYRAYSSAVAYVKGAKEGWCGTALWQWEKKYLPAIAMPRWASRITLKIISMRVERLQEISEEDCRAEGVETDEWLEWREDAESVGLPEGSHIENLKDHFSYVWDSINARYSYPWSSNPWVWVIKFERI